MNSEQLIQLLQSFGALESKAEWIEFKLEAATPDEIGQYISALSNAAALTGQPAGYLVWGIENQTHQPVGSAFQPRRERVGNEDLEHWLRRLLDPEVDFTIYETTWQSKSFAVFEIPAATHRPVAFGGAEYVMVGSSKKPLADFPEKVRRLRALLSRIPSRDPVTRS